MILTPEEQPGQSACGETSKNYFHSHNTPTHNKGTPQEADQPQVSMSAAGARGIDQGLTGKKKAFQYLLLAQLLFLLFPASARASCFNPTGNMGDMIYDSDWHAYQYCNGGAWVQAGHTWCAIEHHEWPHRLVEARRWQRYHCE